MKNIKINNLMITLSYAFGVILTGCNIGSNPNNQFSKSEISRQATAKVEDNLNQHLSINFNDLSIISSIKIKSADSNWVTFSPQQHILIDAKANSKYPGWMVKINTTNNKWFTGYIQNSQNENTINITTHNGRIGYMLDKEFMEFINTEQNQDSILMHCVFGGVVYAVIQCSAINGLTYKGSGLGFGLSSSTFGMFIPDEKFATENYYSKLLYEYPDMQAKIKSGGYQYINFYKNQNQGGRFIGGGPGVGGGAFDKGTFTMNKTANFKLTNTSSNKEQPTILIDNIQYSLKREMSDIEVSHPKKISIRYNINGVNKYADNFRLLYDVKYNECNQSNDNQEMICIFHSTEENYEVSIMKASSSIIIPQFNETNVIDARLDNKEKIIKLINNEPFSVRYFWNTGVDLYATVNFKQFKNKKFELLNFKELPIDSSHIICQTQNQLQEDLRTILYFEGCISKEVNNLAIKLRVYSNDHIAN